MVRVVGKSTVPAGSIGTKPRCGTVSHCIDLDFRSGLLFCNLSSRYIPGYCFMAGGETEEKSFPLFPRFVLVKIRSYGNIYPAGLLGSLEHFTERYVQPITQLKDKSCQNQLKRLLSPFLLRRTKNAVLDELPPKTEIIRDVELSEAEMAQYELLRREAEMTLADATNGDQLKIIAEITRLRLAACNINLVNKAFTTQASKVETFLNIVNELKANNHRALVFSQFTSHLALIRQALDQAGISYLYLDGSTPIRQREQLVAQFQEGTSLLFLKIGRASCRERV